MQWLLQGKSQVYLVKDHVTDSGQKQLPRYISNILGELSNTTLIPWN